MKHHSCGCPAEACGCCRGTEQWTPAPTSNRPGLAALSYRVGTHGQFLETMKARLSTMLVEGAGADGQTIESFRHLEGLTTREPDDPAIALLDAWATAGDVLTFYQERIANEGYLRTASQRLSVLELARLVGYSLRPGVASTVYLAYTLEDQQTEPVVIEAGARSQSIPGPDELPQAFETSEKLLARTEWNNLQVRRTRPQNVTLETVLSIPELYVGGANLNLRKGDKLLFKFGQPAQQHALRIVDQMEADFSGERTLIRLQSAMKGVGETLPLLRALIQSLEPFAGDPGTKRSQDHAQELLEANLMGGYVAPIEWRQRIEQAADVSLPPGVEAILDAFESSVHDILKSPPPGGVTVTDPSKFVNNLLKEPVPQAASSANLTRDLGQAFQPGADAQAQLLVNFAPRLKDTYYTAWRSAQVNATLPALDGIFALRLTIPLFGSTVPKLPKFVNNVLQPPNLWDDWPSLSNDESTDSLFLDQARETVIPESHVVIQKQTFDGPIRLVRQVIAAQTTPRTAYGISGTSTQLTFAEDWWFGGQDSMATLRSTLVFAESERLTIVEEPITPPVNGQEIELAELYDQLRSGRWVIVSGERADIPGVSGIRMSELLMISGVRHDYDPALPGDKTHTTLLLATPTAYQYKRETLVIYGNVVKATHGETRHEVLGSGDGSQSLQSFTLRQPPLTFVPAPTATGAESTLRLFINEMEWHETDSLAGLGPRARNFVTETDDPGATHVIFGNGEQGARLPTGVENVKAVYRNGIGKAGNVKAQQISLLQTRPLGVKSVINPLRASGGADKESRDAARENAPLSVLALDRLVGVQDYADFTRTFAGIGKAVAARLSDGHRELLHLTIAGADDIPIDPTSDLYANLLEALHKLGDPALPVAVESRELIALALSANIRIKADYSWEPVEAEVRAQLLVEFGFQKRALGRPALLCEIIAAIQQVRGVEYVDVDAFGGIPEKTQGQEGTRRLLTLEEISQAIQQILHPDELTDAEVEMPRHRVDASRAGVENGVIYPAQLAIFTPAVPETLILNQIL